MFLADLGLGLFLTVLVALLASLQPSPWLLVAGIVGSLMPDWDMVVYRLRGGKLNQWAHFHHDISHYPLIMIPLYGLTAGYLFGKWYGIIIAVTTAAHYLADSFDIGWGIRWLFPFRKTYFAYRSLGKDDQARFYAWTKDEQTETAIRYGDPNWVKDKGPMWVHEMLFFLATVLAAYCWYF